MGGVSCSGVHSHRFLKNCLGSCLHFLSSAFTPPATALWYLCPHPQALLLLWPPVSFNWKIQGHFSDIALSNHLFPTLDHCKWSFTFFKSSLSISLSFLFEGISLKTSFLSSLEKLPFPPSSQDTLLHSSFLGTFFPFHILCFSGDLTDSHSFNH